MMQFGQVDPGAPPLDLTSQLLPGLLAAENDTSHAARRRTWATHFMPEQMYEYYAQQAALAARALPGSHERVREVPKDFTSVMVLEDKGSEAGASVTGSYGYISTVYKALSVEDGMAYALRRVDNVRAHPKVLLDVTAAWSKVSHPSIIKLRRAFSSTGVGPGSVFFVHDYFPGARTVLEVLRDSKTAPITERTLWSYICQLVTGLRAVHEAGLSFRGIEASHILITGHNRIRLAGAGVLDVLESDSKKSLVDMQNTDMLGLGHLILQIATKSPVIHRTREQIDAALAYVQSTYTYSISSLVILLLSRPVSVQELCRNLAPQMLVELDSLYDHADAMDEVLAREFDNGRLLRSLIKFGFINERPAHENDPSWSETGERYILKLFRDFLFHQCTDEGKPVLDVAHVIDALNRLDRGTEDKILLSSRDGASILVASYASVKRSLNGAFDDLRGESKDFSKTPIPGVIRRVNRSTQRLTSRTAAINAHTAALSAASLLSSVTEAAQAFPTVAGFGEGMPHAGVPSAGYPGVAAGAADAYAGQEYAYNTGFGEEYAEAPPTQEYEYYAQYGQETAAEPPTAWSQTTAAAGHRSGWLDAPAPSNAGWTVAEEADATNLNAAAPEFKPSWMS